MVEPAEDWQRDDRCSKFGSVDFAAVGCVVVGQNSIPAVEATKRSRSAAPIMAAIEVRPARGACHRLEDDRMSSRTAGSKPSRERRVRSDLLAGESRVRRLRLRCAAEVAVVESADLGQGNDASLLG